MSVNDGRCGDSKGDGELGRSEEMVRRMDGWRGLGGNLEGGKRGRGVFITGFFFFFSWSKTAHQDKFTIKVMIPAHSIEKWTIKAVNVS
jgi:hypothetical protein